MEPLKELREDHNCYCDKITTEDGRVLYECKRCHQRFESIGSHLRKCYPDKTEKEKLEKEYRLKKGEVYYKDYATEISKGLWECNGCHKQMDLKKIIVHVKMCPDCIGEERVAEYKKKRQEGYEAKMLEHYGVVNNYQREEVKRQCRKTKAELHDGDEFFTNRPKCAETTFKHFGKCYYFQTDECKKQNEEACLKQFGVRHNWQAENYNTPKRSRYIYNGIQFDSYPEIVYYFICKIKKIPIERNKTVKFPYIFKDKTHYYNPDFIINGNEIVEIKGDQFKDPINGWRYPARKNSKLTKEQIEEENEKYKLKYECAIKNNVKIIYESEFVEYLNKFKKYLRKYKYQKTKKELKENKNEI